MPTGYTSFIENGKINSGCDFLRLCFRAFTISEKDKPLTTFTNLSNIQPDIEFYDKKITESRKQIDKIQTISVQQFIDDFNKENKKSINSYQESNKRNNKILQTCLKIQQEINSISTSSKMKHVIEFAIDQLNLQIDECIEIIKSNNEYLKQINDISVDDAYFTRQNQLNALNRDIYYWEEQKQKEVEGTHEMNVFINEFNELLLHMEKELNK